MERVFPSEIGLVTVVGNAAISITTSPLRRLSWLSLLLRLLGVSLFRLRVLFWLLRAFLLWLYGFIGLRLFLVLGGPDFLFFLLVVLVLLCICRSSGPKGQGQNCCANHYY
jgi:cellulose synthase/poly-beta-1,6-N-acetylglucosamine synthase-like glycosyltransferase